MLTIPCYVTCNCIAKLSCLRQCSMESEFILHLSWRCLDLLRLGLATSVSSTLDTSQVPPLTQVLYEIASAVHPFPSGHVTAPFSPEQSKETNHGVLPIIDMALPPLEIPFKLPPFCTVMSGPIPGHPRAKQSNRKQNFCTLICAGILSIECCIEVQMQKLNVYRPRTHLCKQIFDSL